MKEFDHDMINRYLDGEMNPEELAAFEKKLQTDTGLQQELALLRDVQETLKIKLHPDETESSLLRTLHEMNAAYFQDSRHKAKVVSLSRKRWMTAVAAMFVMALLLTIWQPWKKEDLYKQYAAVEMPGVAQRGVAGDSLMKLAVEHFNKGQFAAAIPFFESTLKDSAENSFVQFYYAVALLNNRDIEKARIQLTELSNGSSVFKQEARFFMALSYLKEKNKEGCKEWLEKIPADSPARTKAVELLKKL